MTRSSLGPALALSALLSALCACTPGVSDPDGGATDAPRRDAPRDAPRVDGGPCVLDEDCPGDPRFFRRCIGGLCADFGCNRDDARCDDGNPCTIDTCETTALCENRPNGVCCATVSECDDGNPCTIDRCESEVCGHEPIFDCGPCPDRDGDTFSADYCGGPDCNDFDPRVHPGATEICAGEGDENCNGLRDLEDLDCQPPTASCDGRVVLASGIAASGTVVSTSFRPDTCGSSAFFEIPLPTESDVDVVLTLDPATPTMGMGFDVRGVELRTLLETTCGDPSTNLLHALSQCDTYPTFFSPSTVRSYSLRRVPAGALFAEVQERLFSGVMGGPELDFEILARVRAAERVECDGAPVALGASTRFGAPSTDGLDCFGPWVGVALPHGPDRVHRFTVAEPSRVMIRATPIDGSVVRVGISDGCSRETARATCEDSIGGTCQDFGLLERILSPGTYYAAVEAGVAYDLRISAEAVGAACVGAAPLVLDAGMVMGDTTGAPNRFEYTGAYYYDRVCGSASGPDRVHTFTLDAPAEVLIEATTPFTSLLRLLTACGGDTSWSSRDGSMVRPLEPGTYFVVVDGADPSQFGPYTLEISTAP